MRVLALVLLLGTLPAAAQTARIYVTNSAGDSIHVIDPATQKVVQTIGPIEAAHGIDFSPDGKRVYVSNEADSTLDVFDRPSGKRIAKVKLYGHPNHIATNKEVDRIKLPDNGYGVQERRMDSPSHGIGVAPDNKTLWVTSIAANAVYAYSLPELKLIGQVALPEIRVAGKKAISSVPNWVTFTPDSRLLYLSNAAAPSRSVVDTQGMKLG